MIRRKGPKGLGSASCSPSDAVGSEDNNPILWRMYVLISNNKGLYVHHSRMFISMYIKICKLSCTLPEMEFQEAIEGRQGEKET